MRYLWPVPPDTPMSRGFIPGEHAGVDFEVPVGSPVVATASGVVRYEADETAGYGNLIVLTHADGSESRYAHLSTFNVGHGDGVGQGDIVGWSGGTAGAPGSGNSTGPHLHFEIRSDANTPVDPLPLLSETMTDPPVPPDAPAFPGTLLVDYTEGEGTITWQGRMSERGWSIVVDDVYGPQSAAVARAFQAEKGLEVDGIVGPITWDAAWSLPVT